MVCQIKIKRELNVRILNQSWRKISDLQNEQIVTTLLGTYLSDEMNFWFTFTLYRYSVSMDTASCTYGKKEETSFLQ